MKKYKYRKTFTYEGRRYSVYGNTEAEVEVKKAMKQRDLEEGKVVLSGNMSVREWSERCISTYKTGVKDITLKKYKQKINHSILEQIGGNTLRSIKPMHCQEILNSLQGKSKAYIREIRQLMFFIFEKAKENKLILENPAEHLVEPTGTKTPRRALTEYEKEIFLKCATDKHYLVFLIMYYCGCRPSEARALKGIDIKKIEGYPVLHIRGTKTKSADRQVPIPSELFQIIKNTEPFSPIACNEAGNEHTEQSFKRAWNSLKREMNLAMGCKTYRNQLIAPYPLAEDLVPYCLRHTYCTNLQKAGVDIRTAQYLMGHADIQMTANIYTHADESTIIKAAELIG